MEAFDWRCKDCFPRFWGEKSPPEIEDVERESEDTCSGDDEGDAEAAGAATGEAAAATAGTCS